MNRSELRASFKDLLNRTDCTDELADRFLSFGLRRVERVLRTPFQKRQAVYQIGEDFGGAIVVPLDYLAMISVKVNGGEALVRTSETLGTLDQYAYGPTSYYIEINRLVIMSSPKLGDTVTVTYYAETPEAEFDAEETPASTVIPDVVTYAALTFAAVHFTDERKADFDGMYKELLGEVQQMADTEGTLGGLVIRNPYEGLA